MSEITDHHITVRLVSGFRFTGEFRDVTGHPSILFDEPPPIGEGRAPNAAAVLGAAIGNCLAASLAFCLRKVRLEVDDLSADVTTHVTRNEQGRFRISAIDVQLRPDLREDDRVRFERCERLFEDFCVVTESVRQGIPVNVTMSREAVPRAGAEEHRAEV
jgi:uncharacterized OsmC-like protein